MFAIENAIEMYANSYMIKFWFWAPLLFNACVYPFHVLVRFRNDRARIAKWRKDTADALARHENSGTGGKTYLPSLSTYDFVSVGSLFKYTALTFLPVLNALATIFDAGPIAWRYLAMRFEWLFSLKLACPPKE